MRTKCKYTFQRCHLVDRFGRVEAQVLGKFAAVLGVLVNTKLNVFAKTFVELVEVLLVFRDLTDEVEGLLDEVLADVLEDLVLLQGFLRDVERKILRVDDILFLLEVLELILLQAETDFSAAAKRGTDIIRDDSECAASRGFPNVLFVIVMF